MAVTAWPLRLLVLCAALFGGTAVALGAYGSHGLSVDEDIQELWRMGVSYQMWHALGAFAAAWLTSIRTGIPSVVALIGGYALLIGAFSFSGTLYYFAIHGEYYLIGAAPIGGYMMMGGWLAMGMAGIWARRIA